MAVDWTTERGPHINTFALIRSGGTDAVITVEFRNIHGNQVMLSSTVGEASLTISSTAKSLPQFLIALGHTAIPGQLPGTARAGTDRTRATWARVRVISGALACNYGGTLDGSAGAGNGFTDADQAPTANSTYLFNAGDQFSIGKVPPQ